MLSGKKVRVSEEGKITWGKGRQDHSRPEREKREDLCTQSSESLTATCDILQSKTDWDGSYFAWYSGDG